MPRPHPGAPGHQARRAAAASPDRPAFIVDVAKDGDGPKIEPKYAGTKTPYLVHLFSDLKRHDMGDAPGNAPTAGNDSGAGVSHPPAVGPRRDGAVSARWPCSDRARRDRSSRRRSDRGARRVSGARREGPRQRARLPGVALARPEALRAMTLRAVRGAAPRCSASGSPSPACGGSTSEQTATWRADCPSLARPEPLSLERGARRASAWPSAGTSCGCGRRRSRAPSCARCTPRSTRSSVAAGQVCLAELAELGPAALRARVQLPRRPRRR